MFLDLETARRSSSSTIAQRETPAVRRPARPSHAHGHSTGVAVAFAIGILRRGCERAEFAPSRLPSAAASPSPATSTTRSHSAPRVCFHRSRTTETPRWSEGQREPNESCGEPLHRIAVAAAAVAAAAVAARCECGPHPSGGRYKADWVAYGPPSCPSPRWLLPHRLPGAPQRETCDSRERVSRRRPNWANA